MCKFTLNKSIFAYVVGL